VRPSTATVPVSGTYHTVCCSAHSAVVCRMSAARLSAVLLSTVAVPEWPDRRAGHHTHFAHIAHIAFHCCAGAH